MLIYRAAPGRESHLEQVRFERTLIKQKTCNIGLYCPEPCRVRGEKSVTERMVYAHDAALLVDLSHQPPSANLP